MQIAAFLGGKGGTTKTASSQLTCLGAYLQGIPAAYVLTDPLRKVREKGRPFAVIDGRLPDELAKIIQGSSRNLNGLMVIDGGGNRPKVTTFDDARAHLKERPDSAGNDARKIMDAELALIAEELQIRLPYLRGDKNDRRMCSDFLDRLIADGRKCLQKKSGTDFPIHSDAIVLLENASRLLVSWGNKSSHSLDVVRPEAAKLIDACEKALEVFRCASCEKQLWFADADNAEWVQCQCSELRWRYGKAA